MNIRRNQQGFTPFHFLVLIALLLLLAFVGWRVWEARSDKEVEAPVASQTTKSADDTPLNYIQPPSEDYRAALPEGWVSGTCPDSPDILFMAPSNDMLGKCNSEFGGTVIISRSDGNTGYGEDYYTSDASYGGVTYEAVTIDGIEGYKVAYTVAGEVMVGPAAGSQIVQYVLFDGTNTWSVTYTQLAGDPDNKAHAQSIAESFDVL